MAILTRERERCVHNSESAVHQRVQGHAPKTLPCASCGKSCVGQLAWQGPSSPWHLTTVQVCGVFLLLSWFSWGPWMAMDGHGVRSHTSPSLQPLRMASISARWIRRSGGAVANIYIYRYIDILLLLWLWLLWWWLLWLLLLYHSLSFHIAPHVFLNIFESHRQPSRCAQPVPGGLFWGVRPDAALAVVLVVPATAGANFEQVTHGQI